MYTVIFTLRGERFAGSPITIGPMMLTQKMDSGSYTVFFQHLIRKLPKLQHRQLVFVTDGEKAILKALQIFSKRHAFWCFSHVYDNIQRKLTQLCIPAGIKKVILYDISQ